MLRVRERPMHDFGHTAPSCINLAQGTVFAMKLWSDYEGRTIDDAYPLKKLVRPEGRSAFFLTTNGTGTPALVRVIEAHFDESEILDRWKAVSEIGQENLITMRKFGETVLDGTPLVYAVMEPTEISLEELLQNRTLTAEETGQLATSVIDALKALHARGMVHGQVDPANILAAGETVKLRSDCVRPAVDDPDGGPTAEQMKAQDAYALAVVLLQALTGRSSLQGSSTLLPSPFDGIIRNGLSGRWGLAEMDTALASVRPKPPAPKPQPAPAVTANPAAAVAPSSPAKPAVPPAASQTEATPASSPITEARPAAAPVQKDLFTETKSATEAPNGSRTASPLEDTPVAAPSSAPDVRHRIVRPVVDEEPRNNRMWLVIAAVVVVVLLLGWRLLRTEPTASTSKAPQPAPTQAAPVPAPSTEKPSATRYAGGKSASPRPQAVPSAARTVTGGDGAKTQWRVVAFTYNHEEQAQQKAGAIQKQHPSLNAEVFSPTGRAPYLVTVGGPMGHDQAMAFKEKARRDGLPRDLYAQNFSR